MSDVTLTEFLLARIAEDEAEPTCDSWNVYGGIGCAACDRVQADCEAKRRIVEDHEHDLSGTYGDKPGCWRCHQDRDYSLIPEGWCLTLRALALPYADHPDFREEWRP